MSPITIAAALKNYGWGAYRRDNEGDARVSDDAALPWSKLEHRYVEVELLNKEMSGTFAR